jgi:hypothetical protein
MGAVLIFVIGSIAVMLISSQRNHAYQREEAAAYKLEAMDEGARAQCNGLPFPEAFLCTANALEPDREDRERLYDLQAQQEMADWALVMALATVAGLAASGVGLWALFRTLDATREANNVLQRSAERQLRAYVQPIDLELQDFVVGKLTRVEWKLKNFGQTPAYNVRYISEIFYPPAPGKQAVRFQKRFSTAKSMVVAPSVAHTVQIKLKNPLPQATYDAVKAGTQIIIFAGCITYLDAFKRRRRTVFRAVLNLDSLSGDGKAVLSAADKHNNAN